MNNRCTYGPCAANIYIDNYQLVLDWAFDSVYLKDENNNWLVFTSNEKYYDRENSFLWNSNQWSKNNNYDTDTFKLYFNDFINIIKENQNKFSERSKISLGLLENMKLLFN